ncbi:MAG: glycosyltransferase [Candidatus Magasanikbacteria bacterium]
MKIALVHDYLAQDGGAELVLRVFKDIWPEAPLFVLFYNKEGVPGFENTDIRESFLARIPFAKKHYQWFLPLMPVATEHHDLRGFDVVLSSTSAFAKGVIVDPDAIHICYCHTPTRYLWTDTHDYISSLKYSRFIKVLLPRLLHKLRMWDRLSAERVDFFIANSHTVAKRIQKYYGKKSHVIYPSIDTQAFRAIPQIAGESYYVVGGRLAAYKRFDLVIHVFNRLGWKLKVFGSGPRWWKDIKKNAKENIEFLGRISDKEKAELLLGAKGLIHPQEEDFGIMPIEAMASGCPVLAYKKGGATESIVEDKTGMFFTLQNWESLYEALLLFDKKEWKREEIREYSLKFDVENFKKQIQSFVEEKWRENI